MTFDENAADREPPQLGGFFIASLRICVFLCAFACKISFTQSRKGRRKGAKIRLGF